jgi:hypothetical protein
MKRIVCISIFFIVFLFLCGCSILKIPAKIIPDSGLDLNSDNTSGEVSQNTSNSTQDNISAYKISDYFPFKENIKYNFEGKGNEYASYSVWVDYIKNNRIQLRKNNGGTEAAVVLENSNGELKIIFSKEECYYREDFTSKPSNKDEILLKEPLKKGTAWTLSDGRKRYISNIDVPVTTDAGSYKTIEVTTEDKNTKTIDYYALNIGLVKTVNSSNGTEITSSLKKVEEDSSLIQNVKFYYPNVTDGKLYFITKKLTFKTNDITKMTLEKNYKEIPKKELGKVLSTNAKIKSLYLNDNVVYVDFTKELVSEMNAGSGYESMILQSITNTLGNYYSVSKVYITVEDKPYSSGHIIMNKGQTFTVNTKGNVEIK